MTDRKPDHEIKTRRVAVTVEIVMDLPNTVAWTDDMARDFALSHYERGAWHSASLNRRVRSAKVAILSRTSVEG